MKKIFFAFLLGLAASAVFSGGSSQKEKKSNNRTSVRDEIFECDRIEGDLKGIPLLNSFSKADRDFFIRVIAFAIDKVNKIVMKQREFILFIKEKRQKCMELTTAEKEQFNKICSFYQTSDILELLKRVAPVPVSLAVAQAIHESKFGSDKNIQRQNAYFGLAKTKTRLLKFDNLFNSAIAYVKTLNVNGKYQGFRKRRMQMMNESGKIEGKELAHYIENYGTDKKYSKYVLQLIKEHQLIHHDDPSQKLNPV
ncbi:MAG: glucosaminidase domain-containing protein [Holosporaceae bacterium]|jgi:Bax protein|nr:glucosaminidase domain-containing protein [Holosporaceae bacterium]